MNIVCCYSLIIGIVCIIVLYYHLFWFYYYCYCGNSLNFSGTWQLSTVCLFFKVIFVTFFLHFFNLLSLSVYIMRLNFKSKPTNHISYKADGRKAQKTSIFVLNYRWLWKNVERHSSVINVNVIARPYFLYWLYFLSHFEAFTRRAFKNAKLKYRIFNWLITNIYSC